MQKKDIGQYQHIPRLFIKMLNKNTWWWLRSRNLQWLESEHGREMEKEEGGNMAEVEDVLHDGELL